jgi:hypothetical protein
MKIILCDHRKTWIANNPRDITDCLLDEQIKENPLPGMYAADLSDSCGIIWDVLHKGEVIGKAGKTK